MRWTSAQEKTITTRDKNILVSAAAGSGKTTVLIERIKQLVLEDHVDRIREVLVFLKGFKEEEE